MRKYRWLRTDYYCPCCGAKDVVEEQTGSWNDPIGERLTFLSCRKTFCPVWDDERTVDPALIDEKKP